MPLACFAAAHREKVFAPFPYRTSGNFYSSSEGGAAVACVETQRRVRVCRNVYHIHFFYLHFFFCFSASLYKISAVSLHWRSRMGVVASCAQLVHSISTFSSRRCIISYAGPVGHECQVAACRSIRLAEFGLLRVAHHFLDLGFNVST